LSTIEVYFWRADSLRKTEEIIILFFYLEKLCYLIRKSILFLSSPIKTRNLGQN